MSIILHVKVFKLHFHALMNSHSLRVSSGSTRIFLASVRRPRTLISIWNFVSCVRGLQPFFFEHARKKDPPNYPVYLHKMTNNKSTLCVKYFIIGQPPGFIDFSICVFVIDGAVNFS